MTNGEKYLAKFDEIRAKDGYAAAIAFAGDCDQCVYFINRSKCEAVGDFSKTCKAGKMAWALREAPEDEDAG